MTIARLALPALVLLAACNKDGAGPKAGGGEPPPMSVADTLAVARAYAQAERLQDAISQYEKARAMGAAGRDESAELASVYDIAGDYTNAERIYREWLAKVPDDAEFVQQLGLTLLLQQRTAEGVAELERATTLAPTDPRIRQDYGYALLQSGDARGAVKVLEAIVEQEPGRSDAWVLLAEAFAARNDHDDMASAIEACTHALRADGTNANALKLRARFRMQADDYERAFIDYELLVHGRPNDPGAYLGSAGALIAMNRLAEAKTRVDRAAELAGTHPWVRLRKAQLAWRSGDRAGYEDLKALAIAHNDSVEVWRDVKDAARKFGDTSVAKEAAAQLARIRSGARAP